MNRPHKLLLAASVAIIALVLGASAVLAIVLVGRGGDADPGWIAFISADEKASDIYLMRPDGSEFRQLTKDGEPKGSLDWSPDGKRVAFSVRTDHYDIWVINSDGTGLKRITDGLADSDQPAWSPDGEFIAFSSDRTGNSEIYVMRSDGSSVRRLTSNLREAYAPDWSPDGRTIVFFAWLGDGRGLMLVNADGSDLRSIPLPDDVCCPAWSPDGSRIAFVYPQEIGSAICVADAEEGAITARVTDGEEDDIHPSWSPDGKRIVFASLRDSAREETDYEIYVVNQDGTNLTRLTNRDGRNYAPKWSP